MVRFFLVRDLQQAPDQLIPDQCVQTGEGFVQNHQFRPVGKGTTTEPP